MLIQRPTFLWKTDRRLYPNLRMSNAAESRDPSSVHEKKSYASNSFNHPLLNSAYDGCDNFLGVQLTAAERKLRCRDQYRRRSMGGCPQHCTHSEGFALKHACLNAALDTLE